MNNRQNSFLFNLLALVGGTIGFALLTLALLALAAPKAHAGGPMPWTQNQFPQFFLTATAPTTNTGTAETVLFQAAIPPNAIGQFLKSTLFLSGDGANTGHVVTVYLGGAATTNGGTLTGGTALYTNSFTTTVAAPVVAWVLPKFLDGITNRVWSSTTTNSYNASLVKQEVKVGTTTNATYLTITGSGAGAGVVTTLDAAIIETLGN
jgi:hypothetical protein